MRKVPVLLGFSFLLLVGCTPSSPPVSEIPNRFPPLGDSEQGERLFERQVMGQPPVSGCGNCHSADQETILVGPSLHQFTSYETDYLTEAIVDPNATLAEGFSGGMIDGYGKSLTDQEIADLIAYIQTFDGN